LRIGLLGECRHWSDRALGRLADHDQGGAKELALLEAFATSAMFTRGNDCAVAAALERGQVLAEALGEPCRRLRLLAAQHMFLTRSGASDRAAEVALRGLELATRFGAPRAQVMSEWMLGVSYHFVGRQKDAQRHCDRGFALAAASARDINFFGYDHHVRAL